jgi:hypothetical protein
MKPMKHIIASLLFVFISASSEAAVWKPKVGDSFEWVLSSSTLSTLPTASVIDMDGFETSTATVAKIHKAGKRAVCYINFGATETYRPDKAKFSASVIGKNYAGWAGERFLDIRKISILAPIMEARLDMCKAKGFDAVEPDNLDSHEQDTGFAIKRADQVRYIKWISVKAHARGLSVGLKNVPDLLPDVINYFDWALTEDCFDQGWCSELRPMIAKGKAVFAVEYTDAGINFTKFCAQMKSYKFYGLLKRRELGAWSKRCVP